MGVGESGLGLAVGVKGPDSRSIVVDLETVEEGGAGGVSSSTVTCTSHCFASGGGVGGGMVREGGTEDWLSARNKPFTSISSRPFYSIVSN